MPNIKEETLPFRLFPRGQLPFLIHPPPPVDDYAQHVNRISFEKWLSTDSQGRGQDWG